MSLRDLIRSRNSALTVAEVAAILNVSRRLVYQLVSAGEIPHFKVGNAVRFDPKPLSDWLQHKLQAWKDLDPENDDRYRGAMDARSGKSAPAESLTTIWREVLLPKV